MEQKPTLSEHDVRAFLQEAPRRMRLPLFKADPRFIVAALSLLLGASGVARATRSGTEAQAPTLVAAQLARGAAELAPRPAPVPAATVATPLPVTLPAETLAVGQHGISAPVSWQVGSGQAEMNASLKNGIIHLAGTPLPGQRGMSTLAGHSSTLPWVRSAFGSVFAPLTNVEIGDAIEINYGGVMYRYAVNKVYEVAPTEVGILGDNSRTGVRLITCTPVGTSLRRLIVEADQTAPDPGANASTPASGSGAVQLPSN